MTPVIFDSNGVRSGSGQSPSISRYSFRNSGRRASHCSRLVMPSRNCPSSRTASRFMKSRIIDDASDNGAAGGSAARAEAASTNAKPARNRMTVFMNSIWDVASVSPGN